MIGYVAKDKNGEIYLYTKEPTYNNELEVWYSPVIGNITNKFPEFDNMSYTDAPIKVEINIKKV